MATGVVYRCVVVSLHLTFDYLKVTAFYANTRIYSTLTANERYNAIEIYEMSVRHP